MILYKFNPKLAAPFKWIHPLKVNEIVALSQLEYPPEIKSLILFGGALELACDRFSDVDLYAVIDNQYELNHDFFEKTNDALRTLIRTATKKYDLIIAQGK